MSNWKAVLGGNDFTSQVIDGDGEVIAFELSQAQAKLIAAAPGMLEALELAEGFISGFEDDETQEGMDFLLACVRNAIKNGKTV